MKGNSGKAMKKRDFYLEFQLSDAVTKGILDRNELLWHASSRLSGREAKAGNWMLELKKSREKCFLLCYKTQTSCRRMAPPTVGWALLRQWVIKTSSIDLPTGQTDERNFSVVVFSSQVIQVLTIKLAVPFSTFTNLYQSIALYNEASFFKKKKKIKGRKTTEHKTSHL